MKKLLTIVLVLFCFLLQAGTPGKIIRVPDVSTSFGDAVSIGTKIINTGTGKEYNSLQPILGSKSISTCSLVTELKEITTPAAGTTGNVMTSDGTGWTSAALPAITLQTVTDVGATTTLPITIAGATITGFTHAGYVIKTNGSGSLYEEALTASAVFKGTYDAVVHSPYLINGSGTTGWYYRVIVEGSVNFGGGAYNVYVGDDIIYDGASWIRLPGQSYVLQTASPTVLGGIKIGDGITMTGDVASVSTTYEAPLTFSTGLNRAGNTITSTITQFTNSNESDPIYTAWDKATGIVITKSQVSDFGSYDPLNTASGLLATHNATYTHSNIANGQTAYGWGNWASNFGTTAGKIAQGNDSRLVSHADVVIDSDFGSQGLMLRGASSGQYSIVTNNSGNWNTAYSNTGKVFITGESVGKTLNTTHFYSTTGGVGDQIWLNFGAIASGSGAPVSSDAIYTGLLAKLDTTKATYVLRGHWNTAYGWGDWHHTTLSGYGITDAATSTHAHGNITNSGYIGTTASLPIITGTGGILQAGSFGTTTGTFLEGRTFGTAANNNTGDFVAKSDSSATAGKKYATGKMLADGLALKAEVGGSTSTDFGIKNVLMPSDFSMQISGSDWGVYNSAATAEWAIKASKTAAWFPGTVTASYFIGQNFTLTSSDRRLKQNIKPLFLDSNGLQFVNYTLIADKSNRKHIGLIAQDVEKILPEAVYTDEKGMKSVDYTSILLAKIIELEARIKKLENEK